MPARSARRPVPALVFLLALAVLAVVVWVRVADRDSSADVGAANCAQAPQLPANSAVTVTVLNGNGATGLASQVLDAFAAYGFTKGNVGDSDDPLPGYATVTSGPNAVAAALLVSYYLPESTVTQDTREDSTVTVTVGQKFISLSTADQVKAAMVKAQVSQTPAAPASGASGSSSPTPTATCFTTPPVPTPASSSPPAS